MYILLGFYLTRWTTQKLITNKKDAFTGIFFVFAEEERAAYTKYTYPLEEVIVNLKDGKHYLKASLALGYGLSDDVSLIKEKEVQIRDTILNILRSKDADEITPIEHTMRLKNEIKGKLNELFSQDIIMDVYITDFLIQWKGEHYAKRGFDTQCFEALLALPVVILLAYISLRLSNKYIHKQENISKGIHIIERGCLYLTSQCCVL